MKSQTIGIHHGDYIDEYVRWAVDLKKPLDALMYTSVLKKLRKKQELWKAFSIDLTPLTQRKYLSLFHPIYEKVIVCKEAYVYEKDYMKKRMHTNIARRPYVYMSVSCADTMIGGIVFREEGSTVYVALRAFDHALVNNTCADALNLNIKKIPLPISLDYFVEMKFIEEMRARGHTLISHGMNIQPRRAGIGLPVFKLKCGARPHVTKKARKIWHPADNLYSGKGSIIFLKPDKSGYFRKAQYYISEESRDAPILKEAEKIFSWAEIELEVL